MVSQGLGFWSHWIFWLWLCWQSGGPQVNVRHMSFPRTILGMLVLKETELRISVYFWSSIHCCWFLLCSIAMDEVNPQGLWHQCEECATLLRQWESYQDCTQPSQHSKTKHIQINHHFLRDHVLKGNISIEHVKTEEQLAANFTKPLDEKIFSKLQCELNILESLNVLWKGHTS